jgi:hypothetical protein
VTNFESAVTAGKNASIWIKLHWIKKNEEKYTHSLLSIERKKTFTMHFFTIVGLSIHFDRKPLMFIDRRKRSTLFYFAKLKMRLDTTSLEEYRD